MIIGEIAVHKWLDNLYFLTAAYMPLWWRWQWLYVMRARFYFERSYGE
jgi:hypothetical protein